MEAAIQSGMFTSRDLRLLNYCRLYLHVTTVSELLNVAGTTILPHMRECTRPPWFDPSLVTVLQKQPSHYQCKTRWSALCDVLLSQGTIGQRNTGQLRLRRETYIVHTFHSTVVYHWYHGTFWQCELSDSSHSQYTMRVPTEWTPTANAIPIDIRARVIKTIYMEQPLPVVTANLNSHNIPQHFEDYLQSRPAWEQDLLNHIDWHHHQPFELMEKWEHMSPDDALYIVSDGSSHDQRAMSFGVIFGNSNGEVWLTVMGPAFGISTSHRAECTGCLAGALLLYHIQLFTNLKLSNTATVITISDNKAMVDSLIKRSTYRNAYANATLVSDWDLLEEIYQTYQAININDHRYEWVRGHQDSLSPKAILSVEAQFNVQADHLASYFLSMVTSKPQPFTPLMRHTRCILQCATNTIHGKYVATLRKSASTPPFREYLLEKHQWSNEVYEDIDWKSFHIAARNYVSTDVHLLKLVHNLLPTRSHTARFQPWISPFCHYCDEPETMVHLQCSSCNSVSHQYRTNLIAALQRYFARNHAPTEFGQVFITAIEQWLNGSTPALQQTGRGTYRSQNTIGWDLLTRGFLSIQWRHFFVFTAHMEKWNIISTEASDELPNEEVEIEFQDDISRSASIASSDDDDQLPGFDQETLLHDNTVPHTRAVDPAVFIAGLIKTMWLEVGTLWRSHLEAQHQTTQTTQSPLLLADLKSKIRQLHRLQHKVLPHHRNTYFHSNLDEYLSSATIHNLQTYIATYRPVIMASIRAAETELLRALTSVNHLPTSESTSLNHVPTHSALEEASHRKRNRLRILSWVVLWITSASRR